MEERGALGREPQVHRLDAPRREGGGGGRIAAAQAHHCRHVEVAEELRVVAGAEAAGGAAAVGS